MRIREDKNEKVNIKELILRSIKDNVNFILIRRASNLIIFILFLFKIRENYKRE